MAKRRFARLEEGCIHALSHCMKCTLYEMQNHNFMNNAYSTVDLILKLGKYS